MLLISLSTNHIVFFLGQDCEIDVSVCNATESKCSNGGECIDGFGPAFHCNCPSGKREKTISTLDFR